MSRTLIYIKSLTMVAGTPQYMPGGQYFRVMDADAALTLTFYGADRQPIAEASGVLGGFSVDAEKFADFLGGRVFSQVMIESATNQTIQVVSSSVLISYDRLTGVVDTLPTAGTTLDSVADVSLTAGATTQIQAADSSRLGIIVTNLPGNVNTFRIGDSGAGASNGVPLAPGESLTIHSQGAVYGYNPGGTAESIAVLLEKS